MLVTRAYRTELDLNDKQVTACKQHAGAARWAYNWGLARRQAEYKATRKSLNAIELHRELNALKKSDLPWMYDVSVRFVEPKPSHRGTARRVTSPDNWLSDVGRDSRPFWC
jgi:hypothetical protein